MHQVDNEPTQTLHIYLEREQPPRPSLLPMFLSVLALSILIAIGVLSPNQQPVTRAVIRVPVVPLTVKTFTAISQIVPTGARTYPATTAHGVLTITNGSIIAQIIPADFTVDNVATDTAVYVPPGSAHGYGYATVSAHALVPGTQGNIPPYAINSVEGSSVYIRNLTAFSGGRDSYSVKYAIAQDMQTALLRARGILLSKSGGLHYPCQEIVNNRNAIINLIVTWRCIFVSYQIPAYMHVTGVQLTGKHVIVSVLYILRPPPMHWVK